MLKLLGIVLFCGLLTPVRGTDPGVRFLVSLGGIVNTVTDVITKDRFLLEHLKAIKIPNIVREGDLLSQLLKITGLHIVDAQHPVVSMELLPAIETRVSVYTKLEIQGDYLLGLVPEPINIFAEVNVTVKFMITDYSSGTDRVVFEDCHFVLVSIDISLLSGLLPVSVNNLLSSALRNTLPSLLCPVFCTIVNLVKVHIVSTENVVYQVGAVGSIQYQLARLPLIYELHASLDLNTVVQLAEGGRVALPAGSAPPALPPLHGSVLHLGLTEAFLSTVLRMLIQIQPQMFAFSPDMCSHCPVSKPLGTEITEAGAPLIALEANKATIKLPVRILVFIYLSDGTLLTVLALKADLALNTDISISDNRLLIKVSVDSLALGLVSSDVGIVHVSDLVMLMLSLLEEVHVPLVKAALSTGIPLPKVLDIDFAGAAVEIGQDLLVLSV